MILKFIEYWDEEKTKIKREYFLNENGERDGLYQEYYEDGNPSIKAYYKDNKKNGVYKSYHSNGTIKFEDNWKDGKKHGVFRATFSSGGVDYEEIYEDGKFIKRTK